MGDAVVAGRRLIPHSPQSDGVAELGGRAVVAVCNVVGGELTNGVIPARVWQKFGRKRDHDLLVGCGLWLADSDGVVMNDYLDYNPSADKVKLQRKAAVERQRRAREAAAAKRGGR